MSVDINELALPDGQIVSDPEEISKLSSDKFTEAIEETSQPLAVIQAKSVEDVQAAVKFANQNQIPVTARGAGTSIVNGSAAEKGGFVIDLTQLNKILEINIPNQYAVVQAGVLNSDLDDEVRKQGYFFSPDPGSKRISSVGGNIATNAGG
ncbi:FAD-binding oxidoreductase [Lentilactobacillus kisonensis]|nr:FAD-binding oxidoreductase [Lentilactobacillus kisonensis]